VLKSYAEPSELRDVCAISESRQDVAADAWVILVSPHRQSRAPKLMTDTDSLFHA